MLNLVYWQVENLNAAVPLEQKGQDFALYFAPAPSIVQFITARTIRGIHARFPDLMIDLNIQKIEDTLGYLLLERSKIIALAVQKRGRLLSGFAEFTIGRFRHELTAATTRERWDGPDQS